MHRVSGWPGALETVVWGLWSRGGLEMQSGTEGCRPKPTQPGRRAGPLPLPSLPVFHLLPGSRSSSSREWKGLDRPNAELFASLNSCLGGPKFETSQKASVTFCGFLRLHPLLLRRFFIVLFPHDDRMGGLHLLKDRAWILGAPPESPAPEAVY